MKLIFAEQAWEDYLYWQTNDKKNVTTPSLSKKIIFIKSKKSLDRFLDTENLTFNL